MAKRGTPHHEYDLLEQVGTGSFGTVHRAVTKSSHEIVAIKIMKKTSKGDCSNAREYRTLKNLALHPNIVKLYDSYVGPAKELYFVMEYMNGGNLYQLIKQRREAERPLEHSEVRSILRQTLTALAHLHQQGIFHRDMKPENLLIGFKNKKTMKSQGQQISNNDNAQKEDEMIIKLADFGLAREIKSKPPYTEYVSTRWYRAPEVLLHSTQYSHPVDIWAVGAIFAELVTLKPIFPGRSEIDQLYRICQILGNPLGTIVIKQRRLTPLLKKSSDQQTPSSSTSAITKKTTITSQHPPSLPPLNHHQQQSPPQQQHQQHDIVQQQQQPPISPPPDPRRDWSDGIRLARKMGFDFPQLSPKPLSIVLPTATQPMLDLLQQFLTFDPTKRINAVDALNSTFLSSKMNAHHSITADTTISDEEGKRNSSARTKSTTTSTSPPSTTTTTTTTSTIPCILIKQLPSTTTNDNNNNNENISPPPEPQPQRKSLLWAKGVAMGPPKTPASPRQSQQQQSVNPKPSSSNMAQDIKEVLVLMILVVLVNNSKDNDLHP
ncbi:kinase-like domain-containing protein [Phascolomyces articulosus]|uniref:Kinase-like domain-containing protein n=1 Tax=Phascolomyces articulosus TaxID=60185 RepID=A0AAD5KN25_9FUNG|nr:kinase-like domain-containing protein [Phascolomyces articulosus]